MADAYEELRVGEQRPLFGSVTIDSGTLRVSSSPSVTLYDGAGLVVTGYNGIPATGWDTEALATVRAWYSLDSSALDPGEYTLVFRLPVVGSDGLSRVYTPEVGVTLQPVLAPPAGGPRLAYPTAADLTALLDGMGLTYAGLDVGSRLAASIAEFERRTGRQMLASLQTRYFDPPDGPRGTLDFGGDLAAVPTLFSYTPTNGAATTFVYLTDYMLLQRNAPSRTVPAPYWGARLLVNRQRWFTPTAPMFYQSLAITGLWGYGTTLPDEVWEAVLAGALMRLGPLLGITKYGALNKWSDAGASEDYGGAPYAKQMAGWKDQFDGVVALYKRVTFG